MKTYKILFKTALLAGLSLILLPGLASAQQMKTLHGHVPHAISRLNLQSNGQLPADTNLTLAISLPPQNQPALDALLSQIYDPGSTNFHHYLKPGEFAARFGPSTEDYQKVIDFATSHGLSIVREYTNHLLLNVSGKASDIEKAFQLNLLTYHHPSENRNFYAPDREPAVSVDLPVSHISGLDNFVIPRPLSGVIPLKEMPSGAKVAAGSGPQGVYWGTDFRSAYAPGVTLNGAGQSVALFELDGYYPTDISDYENYKQPGLPPVTLTNISVDGGVPSPGGGDLEVSLDIEMAISMATNLSEVIVYEAPNSYSTVVDVLQRIADDDSAAQISCSWLIGDNPAFDVYYVQMALQGQSFFQASGDDGAFYEGIIQFTDDTNITLVGGTILSTTGPNGAWSSETTWNLFSAGQGEGPDGQAGSGGGTNINGVPIPAWQQPVSMANNQGSTTLRNVPDVALTADYVYLVYNDGSTGYAWGTSAAAPLWAGFTALINQQAVANGLQTVGFLNPAIYSIGLSTNYNNCFHDVTTGNNTNLTVANAYFAAPGYDLCTGWGTPTGSNLINALTGVLVTNVYTNIYTHLSAPAPPYGTRMANLNGSNPNGNWYLFVQDNQVINSGLVSNGWCVALTTANPIGYVADDYLAMTDSASNIITGADETFYIGVTNYGPNTSSNVTVQDILPLGFDLVGTNATVGSVSVVSQTVNWTIGTLADTVGAQLVLTCQANDAGVDINTAQVSANTPNPNTSDGSAEVVVNVGTASAPTVTSSTIGIGGHFQLTVTGATTPITIQASTNFVTWVNIWTNYTAPFTFTDSVAPGIRYRFYRAVSP